MTRNSKNNFIVLFLSMDFIYCTKFEILYLQFNLFDSNSIHTSNNHIIHKHTHKHTYNSKIYIILFSTDCVFLCTLYSTFFYIFKIFTKNIFTNSIEH